MSPAYLPLAWLAPREGARGPAASYVVGLRHEAGSGSILLEAVASWWLAGCGSSHHREAGPW